MCSTARPELAGAGKSINIALLEALFGCWGRPRRYDRDAGEVYRRNALRRGMRKRRADALRQQALALRRRWEQRPRLVPWKALIRRVYPRPRGATEELDR